MGRCSICKKKILYNEYKVVKGIVYCLNCKVAKTPIEKVVEEIQEYGIIGFTGEPKNTHKLPKVSTAKKSKKHKRSKKRQ